MNDQPQDLTPQQYAKLRKSANGYWVTQITACVLMMMISGAGVVAVWGYGIGFSNGGKTPAGDGLMALLTFLAFLGCCIYLLRIRARHDALGRLR